MDDFQKCVKAAKLIIYDENRMRKFAKMLETPQGAVVAVQTVLGMLQQKVNIRPDIAIRLGRTVYLLMVDLLQDATKKKASGKVMQKVISMIDDAVAQMFMQKQQQPQQPQQAPQGIIGQAQGVPA